MKYVTTILDTVTGESREYDMGLDWEGHSQFWWTEGNGGCDCNRGLFFQRAKSESEEVTYPCDGKRFKVPHVKLADGSVIPIDED